LIVCSQMIISLNVINSNKQYTVFFQEKTLNSC